MKSYIIHLSSAVARQETALDLLKQLPDAQILEATDALHLDEDQITKIYQRQLHRPRYPFPLRNTEVACFLSHRRAWQQIAEGADDMALVVEDDVVLDKSVFNAALAAALENATDEDFVRFPCMKKSKRQLEAGTGMTEMRKPVTVGLGMQAQLIGCRAARRLLKSTDNFDRPVDTTLQLTWITGQPLLEVTPSGVSEISRTIGGSTIGAKKTFREKLYREIARPCYRVALRMAQRLRR